MEPRKFSTTCLFTSLHSTPATRWKKEKKRERETRWSIEETRGKRGIFQPRLCFNRLNWSFLRNSDERNAVLGSRFGLKAASFRRRSIRERKKKAIWPFLRHELPNNLVTARIRRRARYARDPHKQTCTRSLSRARATWLRRILLNSPSKCVNGWDEKQSGEKSIYHGIRFDPWPGKSAWRPRRSRSHGGITLVEIPIGSENANVSTTTLSGNKRREGHRPNSRWLRSLVSGNEHSSLPDYWH